GAMAKTWPGGAAMGSLNTVDSAGSCDSVISGNSGCSDDSMEHLSPEERACLMFLEETIEAMEMMEDSGISNDEPDFGPNLSYVAADPGNTTMNNTTPALDQTIEPTPASAITPKDIETADLEVQSSPSMSRSAPDAAAQLPLSQANAVGAASHDPGNGITTEPCSADASELDLGIIPPPLDFMDEPEPLPLLEVLNEVPPQAETSTEPEAPAPADLQQSELKVSSEKHSLNSFEVDGPSVPPPPAEEDSVPLNPYLDVPEPKAPPAVAPKPKSIPANILLRSHKPTGTGSEANSSHSTASRDMLMDPQKVRLEALRKLGLLKGSQETSPPASALGGSLKSRTSQEVPPVSQGDPPLRSPPSSHVHSQPAASMSLHSVPPAAAPPKLLPAPEAFSDIDGPPPPDNEVAIVSGASVSPPPAPIKQQTTQKISRSATFEQCSLSPCTSMTVQGDNAKLSPKELHKMRSRPASMGCGKDLSRSAGGEPLTGHSLRQQPHSQRPVQNTFQNPRESAKLPRSQGISVLICPRPENAEDRREALKKLGLLRY
uniref:Specifically androgen-regulated gene protein n=1 Tax=Oryzias latipes TaxID=8090 RepID=A0A3P9L2W2_ORYLA